LSKNERDKVKGLVNIRQMKAVFEIREVVEKCIVMKNLTDCEILEAFYFIFRQVSTYDCRIKENFVT